MSEDVLESSAGPGMVVGMQSLIDSTEFHSPPQVAERSPSHFTRDEVMTASEVAQLLQLPVSTVYCLARRGELPGRRLGRTWRFLRSRLKEYLDG